MGEQAVRVMRIVSVDPAAVLDGQGVGLCRFVDADGAPIDIPGGEVAWAAVVGKPAPLSAAEAASGTATTEATISAKVLADEIDRRVAAAIAAIPAG